MKAAHPVPLLLLLACRPAAGPTTTEPPRAEREHDEKPVADEPAYLAAVFMHPPFAELTITEQAIEKKIGRVELDMRYFEISGVAGSLAGPLNQAVRTAARIDEWAHGSAGHVGSVSVECTAGLAFVDLFSFGCDELIDMRTVEEHDNAEGGSPANYTGVAATFAISDGKLIPVQLADLLRPGVDLVAFVRSFAREQDPEDVWVGDTCELGADPIWHLDTDGLRFWDRGSSCNSISIPYEKLGPIAEPGGVIARYVAIAQAEP